jgi:tRNA pseudouridine38-40 synthase
MSHWKLILAYDGTPFHGWQIQPGQPTVQGLLSDAIHRIVGERVLPQGSGRTDAGVHALAQVASFTLQAPIPAANFHNALNRCLPPSVRVLSVEAVPPDFHARHSALRKTYEYRIFPLKPSPNAGARRPILTLPKDLASEVWVHDSICPVFICPPILAPYVWPCPWPLDLCALNHAAAQVLGTHDFTSFAASDPDLTARKASEVIGKNIKSEMKLVNYIDENNVINLSIDSPKSALRTISQSRWHAEGSLFVYRVTANGFLHHMVRNLVGTFVQCGAHRLSPDSIPALLAARNRSAAGPTAPATGLFLVTVEYPPTNNQRPATNNPS